jgi:peptidyl-prolyl cis-trans isomerase SurA
LDQQNRIIVRNSNKRHFLAFLAFAVIKTVSNPNLQTPSMLLKRYLIAMLLPLMAWSATAQTDDRELMRVGDTPVPVSEFMYLYQKTNAGKTDFTEASLREYLDLFSKFKLKVARAYAMRLDTIPTLNRELDQYRKQLSDSYLIDREVTDRLIREVYERSLTDVQASHILIKVVGGDTATALKKARDLMPRVGSVKTKDEFGQMVRMSSEDEATKPNGGDIGWLNVLLPNGFYDLETAIYSLKPGQVSQPVRSPMGYHIVRLNDSRPARGEIEAAHILIRDDKDKPNPGAEAKALSIFEALSTGKATFEELVALNSEDFNTKEKSGYLGFFGINTYEPAFEDAAFGLTADATYSKPVKTAAGWHIIKRVSARKTDSYELSKNRLKPKVQRDDRYRLARKAMMTRIQKDAGFVEDTKVLDTYTATLDSSFLTSSWKKADLKPVTMFTLGGKDFTTAQYQDYLFTNMRKRVDAGRGATAAASAKAVYPDFVEESVIKFEEAQLESKYPEFRLLMREYRDGMLLFEATKQVVWDKAGQDSVGLDKFFATNTGKYMWKERAVCQVVTIRGNGVAQKAVIAKSLRKKGLDATLKKFNATEQVVFVREETYEKGKQARLDAIAWKPGTASASEPSTDGKSESFYVIKSVTPPTSKTLKEARGFVVADYQDFLESQWIDELRKLYPVTVNESVLKSIVK